MTVSSGKNPPDSEHEDLASSALADEMSGLRPLRFGKRRQVLLILALGCLAFLYWFVPPVWRLKSGPVTVTRWDRKLGETRATVGPGLKGWISTKKISRHALQAIIASEDGKFYEHHGFDFEAIRKSYELDLKKGRYVRGGSTLSQQVVKMAFLGRQKTLIRKAREAAGTALMELILSKDKILEWYINLAEFGDGVYGIREGCWHYFKTKPELLSIEQSVHLALVLPSPNAWSKGLRRRSLTPFGQRRFAKILNIMRQMGFITRTQWLTALSRGDFGRPIHGYAGLLRAEENHKALCPGSTGCPDDVDDSESDDGIDDLSFPKAGEATQPPPVLSPPAATDSVTPGTAPSAAPATVTPSANSGPVATPQPQASPATSPPDAAVVTPPASSPAAATDAPSARPAAASDPENAADRAASPPNASPSPLPSTAAPTLPPPPDAASSPAASGSQRQPGTAPTAPGP